LGLLHRHATHECVHPALRPAIGRVLRETNHPRLRASRNDIATRFLQMRQRKPRHEKSGANIHSDRLIEIAHRIILRHRVIEKNARIIHQHIEPFEFRDGQIHTFFRNTLL
jgi:hypothetical protein